MNLNVVFGHILEFFRAFLWGNANGNLWTALLIWFARIISFSILFRTYLGPFILASMSDHIRARSISLRSIRGLYFRRGAQVWHVDRIGISYSSALDGHRGFSIKIMIEGLKLEIGGDDPAPTSLSQSRRKPGLVRSSLISQRLWMLVSRLFSFADPFVRPLMRTFVVSLLRLLIRYLPAISQAVDFDLYSAVVTFTAMPELRFSLEEAKLHTLLAFTQTESAMGVEEKDLNSAKERPSRSFRMAAWKSRLMNSFRRAWDRAWEKTEGKASFSLKCINIMGSTGKVFASASSYLVLVLTL
jgi:hypothetical protein